jgi:hypothetical protein
MLTTPSNPSTETQSPTCTCGGRAPIDIREPFTPKQRVFGTLRLWKMMAEDCKDLNEKRDSLWMAMENCLSWESELMDVPK